MENYTFDFSHRPSSDRAVRYIQIGSNRLKTTPVFDEYWRFAAKRQGVFYRRLGRKNVEASSDPILARYKFTNTYRASDRTSQFLIRSVIYRDDLPSTSEEVFFRILLFKLFNRIDTWEYLERELGPLTWERYRFDVFERALTRRLRGEERIYSAAYIMPSAGSFFGYELKHQNHLKLIEYMMKEQFPRRLGECKAMANAYSLLLSAPSIGSFLAYQYVTDINYSQLTEFGESDFVVAGPGALDGISKCFLNADSVDPAGVIRYMYENQAVHFAENKLPFEDLWGRCLQLIDCQNVFCEISKYARVAFPDLQGTTGRTRIKQKFWPKQDLPRPWYPPKWGLNERVERDLAVWTNQQ
jgi:hypothetical protein